MRSACSLARSALTWIHAPFIVAMKSFAHIEGYRLAAENHLGWLRLNGGATRV